MSKKFTEEQYHEIIKAWESQSFSLKRVQAVIEIMSINDMLSNINEGLALANPASRELAHEQFVEKEPEFHFILKNMYDSDDWRYHLVRNSSDAIILFRFSEEKYDRQKFKESEIKAWGYNPEMFDKEEVY